MSHRRVVVTGMGAITPLGNGVPEFWDGLISARSGIKTVTLFDPMPYDVHFGGECTGFDATKVFDGRTVKRMDRFAQMAMVAAHEAFTQYGPKTGEFDPMRAGVIVGTGIGGISEFEEQYRRLLAKGPSKVSAFTIPKLMPNAAPGHISIHFGFQGVSSAVATACASAGNAMTDVVYAIRRGDLDIAITGGTEAALSHLGLAAFAAMKALSTRNDDPQRASRPFDKNRDGFVLSEGAGILIFEELEHAQRRGATIFAEVVGVGATADAYDMVQPSESGQGAARAMSAAMRDAKINPDEVDYINAHGTSTPLGDIAETKAIKTVFGGHARKLAISSTKSATGHLLGASGGIEAIATVLALRNNTIPPTINLEHPDPDCDLDYVPNVARDARIRYAMNNTFGFGGHNSSMVFKKV